jgi:rubrerythrin
MENKSLHEVIGKLEQLFSTFNGHFFNGELEKPIITISPDTTKGAYGWCTSWKAWKNSTDDKEGYYEINMCAEYLARPFLQTCSTLIHEMVHLLNLQNKVQDTSRSGKYHNKKFKEVAEQHGLIIDKDAKYGGCRTTLTDEAADWIKSVYNNENGFELFRSKAVKVKGKGSSSRKYVCPSCGAIIRATKEVRVTCTDCEVEFEEEI